MSGALGDDSCAPGLPSHGEHYFWVYPPQLPEPKRLSLTDTRRARRPRSCIRVHYLYDVLTPVLPELSPGDLSSFRSSHDEIILPC